MLPAPDRELVDEDVVHDGEQPRAKIGSLLPELAFVPRPGKRVLKQVVGAMNIANEHPRIAAQPRQRSKEVGVRQRYDHSNEYLDFSNEPTSAGGLVDHYSETTCQALLRLSPVLSPGFWSFDHR